MIQGPSPDVQSQSNTTKRDEVIKNQKVVAVCCYRLFVLCFTYAIYTGYSPMENSSRTKQARLLLQSDSSPPLALCLLELASFAVYSIYFQLSLVF
jgi:hypothetical protein